MTKIAINGFGRIGRLFFKKIFFNFSNELKIIAINDLGSIENLAYLLKYDSIYGKFEKDISFNIESKKLIVDKKEILFFQEKNPLNLPWKDLNVDIVIEATGAFESYEKAKNHLQAGAKKVIITAPAKDQDGALGKTILMGINEEEAKSVNITSNGSCTTNAVSPIIQIIHEKIGILKSILNTVHAYTATQNIVDGPVKEGKDFRRGRAGAFNITPSTTGAAIAVTKAIKELENKFDGLALRVPTIIGSIADLTFLTKRKTTAEEINEILECAEKESRWQGLLKTTREQIVSSDIINEDFGAIIDLNFTKVIDGDLVKILSWYDNEAGYVQTLIRHTLLISKLIKIN